MSKLDLEKVRNDFPILGTKVRGFPLVYLDNAATSLKPKQVIDRLTHYYSYETANVHRGAHSLAEKGTLAFEDARNSIRTFLSAAQASEIVFTRGTTESINLVAHSFGRQFLSKGDEIILSELEHHSNIVPWQMIADEIGCQIKVIPIDESGDLNFEEFHKLLSPRTKMVAITWCSNAIGTIVEIEKFIQAAHQVGAKVLVDAAQAVTQFPIDVQKINCDFLAFSGHKIFAPFGIGILYGKSELLEMIPPFQGGGSMISEVTWAKTTWASVPHKFEAGTPNISGVLGLHEAIKYVMAIGFEAIQQHEQEVLLYAVQELNKIPGLKIIGEPRHKAAILSFVMEGAHASDIGSLVDQQGIAIRAGHHCCQPLMRRLGVPATARASFSIYNSKADVDSLKSSLLKAREIFS